MKQTLENLLEFQKTEIEIDRLNDALGLVTEKLDALDAKQNSFLEAFEKDTAAMEHLKKKYRDLESDSKTNESKIAKSQAKLSAVKTNKEYQALLKEIDDIKGMNSALEDEMLVCLDQMESFEEELAKKSRALKQLKGEIASEKEVIQQEAESNTSQLKKIEQLKGQLAGEIDKNMLNDYVRVKRIVKKLALVPVLQAVCQGCHRKIPPQMFIELQRSDQLKFCPHCDRLVFWDKSYE
jgi:uncharacterized protein